MSDALDIMDWLLIVTGLLNMGVSVYAVLVVYRSPALSDWMKRGKYLLVAAAILYAILEFSFVARGTYLTASWVPIAWNLMDAFWMLGGAIYVQAVSQLLNPTNPKSLICNRRKADKQLQITLAAAEKASQRDS
jgi:hypothetical protein